MTRAEKALPFHDLLTCKPRSTSYCEREMKETRRHRHKAVVTHALRQRAGIPYEVERKVCSACERVLDERTVRRAAA